MRLHLAAHGPASRHDLAWWSGAGLRAVDGALTRLGEELTAGTGPDGRVYHDLVGPQPEPRELPGVRLLPEFDALLCAYDPPARVRFVDPVHYQRLWSQDNGMILAPLMVDGRLTGWWRVPGSGPRRPGGHLVLRTRRPRRAELDEPVQHLEGGLRPHRHRAHRHPRGERAPRRAARGVVRVPGLVDAAGSSVQTRPAGGPRASREKDPP